MQAAPAAQLSLDAREAAAHQAAQQLLAEEEEQAAKAAARKAKKLRQKLKKQQQAKGSLPCLEFEDAARLEPTIQASGSQLQSAQTPAPLHSLSQASAAEDKTAESACTPSQVLAAHDSGLVGLVGGQRQQQTSPAAASSSLSSKAQSTSLQEVVRPRLAAGSLGAIHKLLCCPLTEVNPDCWKPDIL